MKRQTKPPSMPRAPVDQSVAGEEDPGAALDTVTTQSAPDVPCGRCGGSGKVGTALCPTCGGTGMTMQRSGGG
jgi:RecJ-like exonuclease